MQKGNNEMITLVERAFSVKDSGKKFSMTIDDHKLICTVLDTHLNVVNEKNAEFKKELIGDVVEVIKQELSAFARARDKKIFRWLLITAFVTFLLSVGVAFLIFLWYHNHYLLIPILSMLL